jgi:hypothetical protein
MTLRKSALLAAAATLVAGGCSTERDTAGLRPQPPNRDPVVFLDGFSPGTDFQAFLGSDFTALSVDTEEKYSGTASLKVSVPGPGSFAGGAFPAGSRRDLSVYDALTFWAKASEPTTFDIVGLGNDNTGTSRYQASWSDVPLTTTWNRFVVPIPLPDKLLAEAGLFFFADAVDAGAAGGVDVWFDEVQFEKVGTISNPRPVMQSRTVETFAGVAVQIGGIRTTFDVGGTDQVIDHFPGYYTFASSDEAVARVLADGTVEAVGSGSATITAKLGDVDVAGSVSMEVRAPDPPVPAPTPTHPVSDVISVFSNAYGSINVSEWSTTWDTAEVYDLQIAGDDVKVYELDELPVPQEPFVGIDFQHDLVDAMSAGMTHLHLDLWIEDSFYAKIKLVDFGSDGVYTDGSVTPCGGTPEADLSQHEAQLLVEDPLVSGAWAQVDIPLVDFASSDIHGDCLTSTAHLAQLIFAVYNPARFAYVDNIYFYK